MPGVGLTMISLAMIAGENGILGTPSCFLFGSAGIAAGTFEIGCSNGGDERPIAVGFMTGGAHPYKLEWRPDIEAYLSFDWQPKSLLLRSSAYLGFGVSHDGVGFRGSPRAIFTSTLALPLAPWAGLFLMHEPIGLSLGTTNSGAYFAKPQVGLKAELPSANIVLFLYLVDTIADLRNYSELLESNIGQEFAVVWSF